MRTRTFNVQIREVIGGPDLLILSAHGPDGEEIGVYRAPWRADLGDDPKELLAVVSLLFSQLLDRVRCADRTIKEVLRAGIGLYSKPAVWRALVEDSDHLRRSVATRSPAQRACARLHEARRLRREERRFRYDPDLAEPNSEDEMLDEEIRARDESARKLIEREDPR